MAFPNSPLDPVPEVWGWPWHGPLTWNGAAGWVTLPSGSMVPCSNIGHWTYLWDIGMPVPDVVTEDPDEQWWNVAVLRAGRGGGALYAYGGMLVDGGPIKLPQGVGGFGWSVTSDNDTQRVRINIGVGFNDEHNARLAAERSIVIPFSELGITTESSATSVEGQVLDRSGDGARMILRLMRGYPPPATAEETVALLELEISGEFSNPVISYDILASGEDCRGRLTITADPGPDPGTIVSAGSNHARVGEFVADFSIESDYWAWYGDDGLPEVVHFSARALCNTTRTASVSGGGADMVFVVSGTTSAIYTYSISAGSRSVSGTANTSWTVNSTTLNEGTPHTTGTGELHVSFSGTTVRDQTYSIDHNAFVGEVGFLSAPAPGTPPASIQALYAYENGGFFGVQPMLAYAALSNLVAEVRMQYPDNVTTEFTPELRWYSSALTPRAVVGAPFIYTTALNQAAGLELASFNPATLQVARHLELPAFSWV